jgi:NADH-quinone oxidoreductase subunit G
MTSFKDAAVDNADVLLPIAPFTETAGTLINAEGRVQSFVGVVRPLGDARPAWKVLRVLGNLLNMEGFDYDSSEAVRDEALRGVEVNSKLGNTLQGLTVQAVAQSAGLQRVADVPVYSSDAIVRRAPPLQATHDALPPSAAMHGDELAKLGLKPGDMVKASQGEGSVRLSVVLDNRLPKGVARVAAGHALTARMGAMFGTISVERA